MTIDYGNSLLVAAPNSQLNNENHRRTKIQLLLLKSFYEYTGLQRFLRETQYLLHVNLQQMLKAQLHSWIIRFARQLHNTVY